MPLALTRKPGETIVLAVDGRRITLEVTRVESGQVRVAIDALDDVAIWWGEIANQ